VRASQGHACLDDFVRALATHAAGRIKNWEIWNEANRPESWTGSIPQLLDMAKRAKAIIQAIDPKGCDSDPIRHRQRKVRSGFRLIWMERRGFCRCDRIPRYCGTDPENIAVLLEKYKQIVGSPRPGEEATLGYRSQLGKVGKAPWQGRPGCLSLPPRIFSICRAGSSGSIGMPGTTTNGERSPEVTKSK